MKEEELLDLMKYAFHKEPTGGPEAFYKLLTMSNVYSKTIDGNLASAIIDTPFRVFWNKHNVNISGIGYVASYPEYRGKSYVSELMLKSLRDNYERGTVFSYLAPFSYRFYRKFGYEYVFNQKEYLIPITEFPKGKKTDGILKRATFSQAVTDMSKIHKLVHESGSINRTLDQWQYYFEFKSKPNFAVYYEDGLPVSYIIYEFVNNTFVIREIISTNISGKDALYYFVSGHASAFEDVLYKSTEEDKLEYLMVEPSEANIQLKPYMMARIVNMKEFMATKPDLDFRVKIIDELIPENNGVYGPEGAEILEMTIARFTQYIMRKSRAVLREYF